MPYIPPVAPVVTPPDHAYMNMIAHSDLAGAFNRGFMAVAQANQAKQRIELEARQAVVSNDIEQQKLELAKEHQSQQYNLATEQLNNSRLVSGARADAERSRMNYFDAKRIHLDQDEAVGANLRREWDFQAANVKSQALEMGKKLGVFDPENITKNPIGFAHGVQMMEDAYGTAPLDTGVPDILGGLKNQANTLPKVRLSIEGENKEYGMLQVARGLQSKDQAERQMWEQALQNAGYIRPGKGQVNQYSTVMGMRVPWTTKKVSDPQTEYVADWIRTGKSVDVNKRAESLVPPTMSRRRPGKNERALPEPEMTDVDQIIDMAKKAVPKKGRAAVEAILRSKGIDPSLLDK